ncbi:fibronectin type III domain-containing protein [Flavimobilis sp. GY10621]|uniref:Fibronectin type III domain-containing protein n=1 Tax=Flavimobilis rhizosphaerae TaxID=2775421 RepID=A0ABR9DQX8_9MICO|nr:fibronectin type III domain-containing protein [Flavimobilis rhizosphaerae]MBD9698712.1 fibronectin type III domain-containing protein [Flavimobilis rhizosphaerae]
MTTTRRARQLDKAAGLSPRRRWATYSAVGLVPAVLATLALVNPGVTVEQVELNDGGVWLTYRNQQKLARYSSQVKELDGGLVAQGGNVFEVLQSGRDVVLVEPGALTLVDPAAVALTSAIEVGGTESVSVAGGSYAVTSADGHVWAGRTTDLGALSLEPESATLTLGAGAVAVATDAGDVVALDPATGTVHRGDLQDEALTFAEDGTMKDAGEAVTAALAAAPNPPGGVDAMVGGIAQPVQAAAVGDQLVVLAGTTLFGDGWSSDVSGAGADPVLQLTGPAHDVVLVATGTNLARIPSSGGDVELVAPGATGAAAAPVVARGCEYGAWSTPTASYLRRCAGQEDQVESLEGMTASTQLRFRVNRGIVVLNDVVGGMMWLPEDVPQMLTPNWQDIEDRTEAETEKDSDAQDQEKDDAVDTCRDEESEPMPEPDVFGVRAGRTTVLPVLDNDVNTECGVLTVASIDPLPEEVGHIQAIAGGRSLQVVVKPGASGTYTLNYTVSDGRRRGTPPASTVRIRVTPDGDDGSPSQVRVPVAQVEARAATEVDVLSSFLDPDGDDLRLVGASTVEGAQVTSRQDGLLRFQAGDRLGRHRVSVRVTDGSTDPVEGEVLVDVRAAGTLAPQLDPLLAETFVGEPVQVDVLAAVRPTTVAPVTLTAVDAVEGVEVTPDLATGTFMFSAPAAGSYYVPFTVSAGSQTTRGLARIEVIERPESVLPPVAVSDRAMLPNGGEVTISPTANDTDPNGLVLVLTSVRAEEGSALRLGVLGHELLRITATRRLEGPEKVRYTVSNGITESTGEILVIPKAAESKDRAPVARDVEVTVRTGGVVTIPVLESASDPDGDKVSLRGTLVEEPSEGLMFVSGDVLRFQAPSSPSTVTARFAVVDPHGNEAAARVTINVRASDPATKAPPRPQDVEARVFAGQRVRVTIPLVGIDDDGDGVLLLGQASAPTKGLVVSTGPDYLEYEAFPDSSGTDTFTYAVEDWVGQRAVATVRVGIAKAPADPPAIVARDDEVRVRPGERVEVRVLLNDVDPSGGELTLTSPLEPVDGITELGIEGRRIVAVAPEKPGTYNVPYRVSNEFGAWATATLAIVVSTDARILPPIANDVVVPATETIEKTSVKVDVLAVAVNPSGPLSDLALSVPSSHADQARVVDGKVEVTLGPTARTVPFLLTNTRPEAEGAHAYAFVTVPALGDFPPVKRPKARDLRVGAGEELLIDIAEFVQVGPGKTARIASEQSVTATRSDGSSLVVDETTLRYVSDKTFQGGPASITFDVVDGPVGMLGTRTATISLPITVFATATVPPTFQPRLIEVAQGGAPISLDLTRVTVGPEGVTPEQNRYTYSIVQAPSGSSGVTATLSGSVLTLAAAPGATRGAVGTVSLAIGYGEGQSLPAQIDFRVLASDRQLARVSDIERNVAAGEAVTFNVLEGVFNPFDRPLRVVSAANETGGVSVPVSISASSVTVTPPADHVGRLTVRFAVRDETDDPAREVGGQIVLNVRAAPDVPTGLTVGAVGNRTVELSWLAPAANGTPITGYVVVDQTGKERSCASTSCTMTELKNGTEYTFRVRAVNEIGSSELSAPVGPATPDTLPEAPAAPQVKFGDGELKVTWNQPATEGSPVAKYRIELRGTGAPGVVDETALTRTFTGLRNGESYSVRVRAVSSRDQEGPWSPIVTEVPAGVPGAPVVTATRSNDSKIGHGVVNVRWDKAPDNGAPIKSYAVTATPEGGGSTVTGTLTGETTALLEGVRNGVTYTVRVVATNKAGEGAPGRTTVRTWVAPSPVLSGRSEAATGRAFGEGVVTYSWSKPDNLGGAGIGLEHYEVSESGGRTTTVRSSEYVASGLAGGTTSPSIAVRACTIPEAGGNVVCSETVRIEGKKVVTASAPAKIEFGKASPGFYSVRITAPSNSPEGRPESGGSDVETTYSVKVGDGETKSGTLRTGESVTVANDPGAEDTAVRPGTTITVTTRTVNALGQAVKAEAYDKVAEDADSAAPGSITDLSEEPQILAVQWSYSAPVFWRVQGFDVYYRPKGSGGEGTFLGSAAKDAREYTHPSKIAPGWYDVRIVLRAKYFGSDREKTSAWKEIYVDHEPTPPPTEPPTTEPTDPPTDDSADGAGA